MDGPTGPRDDAADDADTCAQCPATRTCALALPDREPDDIETVWHVVVAYQEEFGFGRSDVGDVIYYVGEFEVRLWFAWT